MKRLVVIFVSLALLTGCAGLRAIEDGYQAASQITVTQKDAYLAAASFDILEITATNYVRLPRCAVTRSVICRDPALTPKIKAAILSGRTSRNNLKAYIRIHLAEGENATIGAVNDFNTLTAAIETIKAITAAYSAAIAAK